MNTEIVFSRVNNLTDARYAAAIGATWIGFCFNSDHPQYISPLKAKEIAGWLTGVKFFGEFQDQTADEIKGISAIAGLEGIELPAEMYEEEKIPTGMATFLNLEWQPENTLSLNGRIRAMGRDDIRYIVRAAIATDTADQLSALMNLPQIIWEFQAPAELITSITQKYNIQALSFSGNNEDQPGLSDLDNIREVIDTLLEI